MHKRMSSHAQHKGPNVLGRGQELREVFEIKKNEQGQPMFGHPERDRDSMLNLKELESEVEVDDLMF